MKTLVIRKTEINIIRYNFILICLDKIEKASNTKEERNRKSHKMLARIYIGTFTLEPSGKTKDR